MQLHTPDCCVWEHNCQGPAHVSGGITGRKNITTENAGGGGEFFGERRGESWVYTKKDRIIPFLHSISILALLFAGTVTRREINFTLTYLTAH